MTGRSAETGPGADAGGASVSQQDEESPPGELLASWRQRLPALLMTALFDLAGPLVVFFVMRSQGFSEVISLVVSGIPPAVGVLITILRDHRVDTLGVLVLAGVAVGSILGLVTHNARLVLLEGSVPTGIFGLLCVASVRSRRPLMFRFVWEFMGPDTPRGRRFDSLWKHEGFRRYFRVVSAVWGIAYLAEAGARVVIVESYSAGTAFTISKFMPYVIGVFLGAWSLAYARRVWRRGQ